MSRNSPHSISPPPRGSRPHSHVSDANIRNFAPVARIMKTALPENAKIAKEAKECMQECVSEFISFITSEGLLTPFLYDNRLPDSLCPSASEKCQQEKRKTVNGEDILFAMTSTGFENYAEALKIYLAKYREVSPSRLLPLQPYLDILFFFPFLNRIRGIHINILTTVYSPNHNEEMPSRGGRAVATAPKRRNRVQPVRAQLGSRIRQARQRTKDKKKVSTTSSVLTDRIPLSS